MREVFSGANPAMIFVFGLIMIFGVLQIALWVCSGVCFVCVVAWNVATKPEFRREWSWYRNRQQRGILDAVKCALSALADRARYG